MRATRRKERQSLFVLLAFFVIGVGMALYCGYPKGRPAADALVRAGIGEDLFSGVTRGRQGLVGSLRWAPLPTLCAVPFLSLPSVELPAWAGMRRLEFGPFAMVCVAAASYALLCAFLNAWWGGRGTGSGVRIPTLLALYLSPWVRQQITSGSSTALFVLLLVMTVCTFIDWWRTDELRSLAYLSIVVGLGLLVRYQFALVFLAILLAVFVHVVFRHPKRQAWAYCEGTLILYAMPAVYLAAVWLMANWLIMGDAFFFVRGLPWGDWRAVAWQPLLHDGCRWAAAGIPLAIALVGYLGMHVFARHRVLSGLPAAALAVFVLLMPISPADTEMGEVPEVADMLQRLDDDARVVVAGQSGYVMRYYAAPRVRQMLDDVHTLSFYRGESEVKTRGKRLYIAAPPNTAEYRWEDLHLKYPAIYSARNIFVVFEAESLGWRLLGVTRTDNP